MHGPERPLQRRQLEEVHWTAGASVRSRADELGIELGTSTNPWAVVDSVTLLLQGTDSALASPDQGLRSLGAIELGTPASGVFLERAFSAAGRADAAQRQGLLPATLEALTVVALNRHRFPLRLPDEQTPDHVDEVHVV